ncbi:hypothetical protein HYPSUDRAFT_578000 [Hypholoma sublateritium FD-334 SS-4]|uniref:Uncharacterized protein n=1 Tax=Hypholoma sublateritium (strain FD-334 SS-4) TaxID=945553 RepID=A0A0D2NXG6_HYPSF|nr:hypothetical protein HYPSUDRAFT_578000 [Hypholoma sublateritium FD-334 SS-4]
MNTPMYSTQDVPSSNAGKLAVFRNIDIMDTIFDALLVKYDADACERKHLFQAALTAKNFYDPAMNILWRSLDSLLPVLKLIPGFQELIDPPIEDSEYYVCKNDLDFGHFSELPRRQQRRLSQKKTWSESTGIADVSDILHCYATLVLSAPGYQPTYILH